LIISRYNYKLRKEYYSILLLNFLTNKGKSICRKFCGKSFEVLVQGGGLYQCANNNLSPKAKIALGNIL